MDETTNNKTCKHRFIRLADVEDTNGVCYGCEKRVDKSTDGNWRTLKEEAFKKRSDYVHNLKKEGR